MAPKNKLPLVITGIDEHLGAAVVGAAIKDGWEVLPFSIGETDKWYRVGKKEFRVWNDLEFFIRLLKRENYLVVECREDRVLEAVEYFGLEAGKPLAIAYSMRPGEMEAIAAVVNVSGRDCLVLTTNQQHPIDKIPGKVVHEILPGLVELLRENRRGVYRIDLFD